MNINIATKDNQETIINNQGISKLTLEEVNAKVTSLEVLVNALAENGSSVVKSVQRGYYSEVVEKLKTNILNIERVNLDKSILIHENLSDRLSVTLTTKGLEFQNINEANNVTAKVGWQVIEFY